MISILVTAVAAAYLVSERSNAPDPFAEITPLQDSVTRSARTFFNDNFAFRGELMSAFDSHLVGNGASRQSLGWELQKKFSTGTSTIADFDFQGRIVRRDGYNPVPNDMEGATSPGWSFEYHNLYLDLYNIFGGVGRFNFRAGHFYVPFGLNLQTDTHATLLQLSNGDNFGFDEDWGAGFWGAISRNLHYDLYYMMGAGHQFQLKGQTGLAALRISLANRYASQYGLEGGVSLIGGQRLAMLETVVVEPLARVETRRIGADARYRRPARSGSLAFTTELSGGRDNAASVVTLLHQAEYLRASRRWSVGSQFRNFYREFGQSTGAVIGEFTWHFRNDVAGSNLHWIKLNVERQVANAGLPSHTIVTLQYYLYR